MNDFEGIEYRKLMHKGLIFLIFGIVILCTLYGAMAQSTEAVSVKDAPGIGSVSCSQTVFGLSPWIECRATPYYAAASKPSVCVTFYGDVQGFTAQQWKQGAEHFYDDCRVSYFMDGIWPSSSRDCTRKASYYADWSAVESYGKFCFILDASQGSESRFRFRADRMPGKPIKYDVRMASEDALKSVTLDPYWNGSFSSKQEIRLTPLWTKMGYRGKLLLNTTSPQYRAPLGEIAIVDSRTNRTLPWISYPYNNASDFNSPSTFLLINFTNITLGSPFNITVYYNGTSVQRWMANDLFPDFDLVWAGGVENRTMYVDDDNRTSVQDFGNGVNSGAMQNTDNQTILISYKIDSQDVNKWVTFNWKLNGGTNVFLGESIYGHDPNNYSVAGDGGGFGATTPCPRYNDQFDNWMLRMNGSNQFNWYSLRSNMQCYQRNHAGYFIQFETYFDAGGYAAGLDTFIVYDDFDDRNPSLVYGGQETEVPAGPSLTVNITYPMNRSYIYPDPYVFNATVSAASTCNYSIGAYHHNAGWNTTLAQSYPFEPHMFGDIYVTYSCNTSLVSNTTSKWLHVNWTPTCRAANFTAEESAVIMVNTSYYSSDNDSVAFVFGFGNSSYYNVTFSNVTGFFSIVPQANYSDTGIPFGYNISDGSYTVNCNFTLAWTDNAAPTGETLTGLTALNSSILLLIALALFFVMLVFSEIYGGMYYLATSFIGVGVWMLLYRHYDAFIHIPFMLFVICVLFRMIYKWNRLEGRRR